MLVTVAGRLRALVGQTLPTRRGRFQPGAYEVWFVLFARRSEVTFGGTKSSLVLTGQVPASSVTGIPPGPWWTWADQWRHQ